MRAHTFPVLIAVVLATGAVFAESDWTSVDIGTSTVGATSAVEDGYDIAGSGADIWGASDGFRYVYQPISGDFSIKVRLASVSPTNTWSKAGLMVRQSTDANSAHVMMVATPSSNGFALQYRSVADGSSSHVAGGAVAYPNSWVKLVRVGSLVTAYKATDAAGTAFQQVGSALALNLTDPVLVGMCVTAHADGQLCTAQFRDLALEPVPTGTGEGLAAAYFGNDTLSGDPLITRVDPQVNFPWNSSAPDAAVPADHFSVRWQGQVEAQFSETYTFTTRTDDGCRLWVDGRLIVDKWRAQSATSWSGTVGLIAGQKYDIKLEYVEYTGSAIAQIYWSSPRTPKQVIAKKQLYPGLAAPTVTSSAPIAGATVDPLKTNSVSVLFSQPMNQASAESAFALTPPAAGTFSWSGNKMTFTTNAPLASVTDYTVTVGTGAQDLNGRGLVHDYAYSFHTAFGLGSGTGLVGQYYDNMDLTSLRVVRLDPQVNFSWNSGSPYSSIEADTFSARWVGTVQPRFSELYTFYSYMDNGMRLWVNGVLLIDEWRDIPPREARGQIALTAGQKYEIKLEFMENWGGAAVNLSWSSASQPKQIIPQQYLYPPEDNAPPSTPTGLAATLVADRTVVLGWNNSTDDTVIARYDVYRNGNLIGWTCEPVYRDTNLTPLTGYSYSVQAVDYSGKVSGMSETVSVTTLALPTSGTGTGLLGQYYDEMSFSQRKVVRVDPKIDFNFGTGAPDSAVGPDTFSARWEGWVQPFYTGQYAFYSVSDDGIRIWVDGQIVIDNWTNHSPTENKGYAILKAGQRYSIRVDYFENTGGAVSRLYWESAAQPKEIIPTTQLYPAQWLGGTTISLLTSVDSPVSPAWFEGSCSEDAASIRYSMGSGNLQDAVRENPKQFYIDTATAQGLPYGIPLDKDNPTAISVTAADSGTGTQTYDYSLTWKPTVLNGKSWSNDEIVIRVNDSLLFTVEGDEEDYVELEAGDGGLVDYQGLATNMRFPFKYAEAGHYTVTAWLNGEICGTLMVTVVDVDFDGPIACQVGFTREKNVVVSPVVVRDRVSFVSEDAAFLGSSVKEETASGVRLFLCPIQRGTPVLQARLGLGKGPLICKRRVDEFTLRSTVLRCLFLDYTGKGRARLYIYPHVLDLNAHFDMFGSRSTFEGGETTFISNTSSFQSTINRDEPAGLLTYYIEVPSGERSYCFSYTLTQAGEVVGGAQ